MKKIELQEFWRSLDDSLNFLHDVESREFVMTDLVNKLAQAIEDLQKQADNIQEEVNSLKFRNKRLR